MTNSWAMLFDELNGEESDSVSGAVDFTAYDETMNFAAGYFVPAAHGEDIITFGDFIEPESEVVITDDTVHTSSKDNTFWKYSEGKILREVEAYLSGTYKGHYVGDENKIQTIDLIDSNGDAEAFCRSNIVKYASRFGKKDGKNPKDLLKVIHYAFLLYHFSELPFSEDATETFCPTGR